MASHPIQSLVVITSTILIGFSVETKIWEKKRAQTAGGITLSGTAVVKNPASNAPIVGPSAKQLSDQYMTMGADGEQKVQIDAKNHRTGILLEVRQIVDPDRAFPCEVILTDIKKIESGQAHAVPDLHKPDGSFKYGRVFLELATNHKELYYNNAESWWLISQGIIGYAWGSQRERGQIGLPAGTWIASSEITVGEFKFVRQITFSCDGKGEAQLV
jgi:hypothetical protein